MANLLNFKRWLSIEEAAAVLSEDFGRPLSKGDIYQLCTDGYLPLSVIFNAPEIATQYRFICNKNEIDQYKMELFSFQTLQLNIQIEKQFGTRHNPQALKLWDETAERFRDGDNYHEKELFNRFFNTLPIDAYTSDALFLPNGKVYMPVQRKAEISGLFKLAMIGNEKLDIEFLLCQEKGMKQPDLINIEGFFILDDEEKNLFSVQATEYKKSKNCKQREEWYYPAGGIKAFSAADFVCSQKDLKAFQLKLHVEKEISLKNADKQPSTKTINKQAEIIAALAVLFTKTDGTQPYEMAETILQEWQRNTVKIGSPPSKETLAKYISNGLDRIKP